MSFSQNFNKWLKEQGKDPITDEEAKLLDEAFAATREALADPVVIESFQQGASEIVHEHLEGKDVDVAQKACEAWDRVKEKDSDE